MHTERRSEEKQREKDREEGSQWSRLTTTAAAGAGGGAAGVVFRGVGSPAVAPSPWALAFTPPPPWSSELGLGRTCRLPAPVLGMPDLPWPPTVRESSNAEALAVAASSAATAIALMVRERIWTFLSIRGEQNSQADKRSPGTFWHKPTGDFC